jgi:hypothetical protein
MKRIISVLALPLLLSVGRMRKLKVEKYRVYALVATSIFCMSLLVGCVQESSIKQETAQEVNQEINKMINVSMNVNIEEEANKQVRVKGETNLPNSMELMISVKNDSGYLAQDKVNVVNGAFISNPFSNNANGLNGSYTAEITSPTANTQPVEIKNEIGENGKNLDGQYVKEDSVWGKMVNYTKQFTVEGSALSSKSQSDINVVADNTDLSTFEKKRDELRAKGDSTNGNEWVKMNSTQKKDIVGNTLLKFAKNKYKVDNLFEFDYYVNELDSYYKDESSLSTTVSDAVEKFGLSSGNLH